MDERVVKSRGRVCKSAWESSIEIHVSPPLPLGEAKELGHASFKELFLDILFLSCLF